jgi:sulfur relay (sulfurtransferase) complex TusBCD TusD component (DsrE family)
MGRMLVLLCDSPYHHESVDHVIELTKAAIAKGHTVDIYLMMDGVYNPIVSQSGEPFHMESISDQFKALLKLGTKVSGCRVCMELRGVDSNSLPQGTDIGGIFDLSEMLTEADVVLSFTGAA